jgi:hypothetical protein
MHSVTFSKPGVIETHHVIHENNVGADVLSKLRSDRANIPLGVFVHELHDPSIKVLDSSLGHINEKRIENSIKIVY